MEEEMQDVPRKLKKIQDIACAKEMPPTKAMQMAQATKRGALPHYSVDNLQDMANTVMKQATRPEPLKEIKYKVTYSKDMEKDAMGYPVIPEGAEVLVLEKQQQPDLKPLQLFNELCAVCKHDPFKNLKEQETDAKIVTDKGVEVDPNKIDYSQYTEAEIQQLLSLLDKGLGKGKVVEDEVQQVDAEFEIE